MARFDCQRGGLDCQIGVMVVCECYFPLCLTLVLKRYPLFLDLPDLDEPHVDEWLKQQMTLHSVDSDRQLQPAPVICGDNDLLILVLQDHTLILDLRQHCQLRSDLLLQVILNLKTRISWLLQTNPHCFFAEVPDLDRDLVDLVELDILEDYLRRIHLEGGRVFDLPDCFDRQ